VSHPIGILDTYTDGGILPLKRRTALSETVAVRIDSKGRLTLPLKARKALGVVPGSTVFIQSEGNVLRIARAENPFDGLAHDAIEEDRRGRTRGLREFARDENIRVDAG
jgi:bifunctional DNA-binding transcriptional regulator/antitoxin component of YhaV-PrlF toxin-antitoxin module